MKLKSLLNKSGEANLQWLPMVVDRIRASNRGFGILSAGRMPCPSAPHRVYVTLHHHAKLKFMQSLELARTASSHKNSLATSIW